MKLKFDSYCVKEVKDTKSTKPHILPLYLTTAYVFEDIQEGIDIFTGEKTGHVYSRYGNPTMDAVAQKLADLEVFGSDMQAYGQFCSSGMSAISTILMSLTQSGDCILTQGNLYGGTTELVQKIISRTGVSCIIEDFTDLDKVETCLKTSPNIKLLYLETPTNPTLSCVDLEAIAHLAKRYQVKTVCDNTFCTAYLQQPLLLGIDFVIHSTTKYYNGHGTGMGGVIISTHKDFMKKEVFEQMKLLGTNGNPFDAWLVHNGLKTLSLRMDRHGTNAMELARFLSKHPSVKFVNYPGLKEHTSHTIAKKQMRNFGGMLSFELKGGLDAGKRAMDKIQLCVLAPTLGNVDTLILHPASMSHIKVDKDVRAKYGITDGLIRLSVGIENKEDLMMDIDQAIS